MLLLACAAPRAPVSQAEARGPLVSVSDVDSTIIVEARYFGRHNFIGRPITGYEAPKCLLTPAAARALAAVQEDVRGYGLSLKTYDCYRPQRAVDDFVRWARATSDTAMKAEFYPAVDKQNLFRDGYIAERSGHSRGSTVDLTLVPLPVPEQPEYRPGDALTDCRSPARYADNTLDMGTGYDASIPCHTRRIRRWDRWLHVTGSCSGSPWRGTDSAITPMSGGTLPCAMSRIQTPISTCLYVENDVG